MNSHVKVHACTHTHTHIYSHKHWKLFYKHKFSYTTHFAAYTTEAWVTVQLLHRHTRMPWLTKGSQGHCTIIQSSMMTLLTTLSSSQ